MSDTYERIIAAASRGIYESNYLNANSPDGQRALWIKHNALVPIEGDGTAEFWVILFQRGRAPIVAKRERPWSSVVASKESIALSCGEISLQPDRARGQIADISWDLRLSDPMPPLLHFPFDRMYTGPFPKKKMLTPAPNLHIDGLLQFGSERWELSSWVGLRGHNWGREHAHCYAYGSCNLWEDGSTTRAVDGFTAQIKLGARKSPWLTSVVGHDPHISKNSPRHWFRSGTVEPGRWEARFSRPWGGVSVRFAADPSTYAGLRYIHPDGRESYCYNTKFADVDLRVGRSSYRSRMGELEVLFPDPLPGVPLHPVAGFDFGAKDYRSV